MDNKKLGIIIIIVSVLLSITLFYVKQEIDRSYQAQIDFYGESCPTDPDICPHALMEKASIPIYVAIAFVVAFISLALYLIFFEKSQKAIISTLEKQRQIQTEEEKFNILLKGLNADEQKVIKAIKDQDGITQQTLRLRTDMHKSKLSIILDNLEKKGLIARKEKGKTKQVFIKVGL